MDSQTRVMQKYSNRRIYDTAAHRYITLRDLQQLVLNNVDFIVRDKRSQADITVPTLLNVLAQASASRSAPLLDRQFLLNVIRTYTATAQESARLVGEAAPEQASLTAEALPH